MFVQITNSTAQDNGSVKK